MRRSLGERKRGGGGCLRFNAPNVDLGLERLDRAADAGDESAAADAGDDGFRIGRVFQNLETHRSVTGDEVVIVERVHKRSFGSRIRTLLERLPCDIVWNRDELCAERPHPVDLGFRRRLDYDNGARHTCLSRRVGDALSCISRADRPHAALALRFGEHRHRVGGAAQFVGIDRLQIFQLQSDVGKVRSEFETNQRRAHDRLCDPGARFSDLGEFNRANSFECRRHGVSVIQRREESEQSDFGTDRRPAESKSVGEAVRFPWDANGVPYSQCKTLSILARRPGERALA